MLFALGIMYRSIPLLFFSRALSGFMGGNISIAVAAIADVSDEKSRPRNFGLIGMAFGLGFILGPFIGGKLSDPNVLPWFTLATPFWFAAALTLFDIFLFFWIFRETLAAKISTPVSLLTGFRNIKKAFQLRHMRAILLVIFLLTLGFNFFTQFFQYFLIDKFSFDLVKIGELFAFVGLCIALVQGLVIRPVSKRFTPPQVLSFSIIGLALTLPALLIPDTILGLYLMMPLIALFQGLTEPNSTTIVSNMTDRESQGEIMGIKQSIQSLAQALPPLFAGLLAVLSGELAVDGPTTLSRALASPPLYMILSGVVTLFAFFIFIFLFQDKKPPETFHEV
jgi:DHA1 family tetracycline resistance protein-like MFS transporter